MRHDGVLGRKVAGRFMVKRLLGEGGMASVYVAERDAEPREVALKIMDPALTSDRSFVRRFQREAKAASRVKHPNSVKIFEYGVEGRLSYIVMELLVGGDLYSLLERDGAISQWRAVRLLSEVCDALMVAHEMGIVHRDLKPENIMVIPDATHPHGERVKVLDFGIAKVLDNDVDDEPEQPPDSRLDPPSAITRAGTLVGTPAYMSPEQCGLLSVDTRADIYTCGVLLYQLVTGRLPFEGETPLHTATLHIHSPVPAPSAVAPQIDRRLDALIMKALAKKPAERHQTARHLGASLRKLLPDIPDVSVGEGAVSRRQTSSMWPREVMPPPDPPSRPEASLESARTLTSPLEVGPPPPVHLHQTPPPPPPPRPPGKSPAIPRAAAPYTPLELPPSDPDGELSTVTLVRPETHSLDGPATPRVPVRPTPPPVEDRDSAPAMIREVKTTLRSADDFGLRASERRPDVQIPLSASHAGEGAPPSLDLDFQGSPTDSSAYGAPQESGSKRLVHTIRMQHTGPGPDPMPPPARPREPSVPDSELSAFAATAKALPPMAGRMPLGSAPTIPMPSPQPQPPVRPIHQLPPTMNDLPHHPMGMPLAFPRPARGLLSGKIGMLIGFLAGMLITAALVALYLLFSR